MPKMRATESRYIEVEVSMDEIIKKVESKVRSRMNWPGEYINRNGNWEIDHGGHGSGYRETLREVTEDERKQWESLQFILKLLRS
jgi:hypothetical protein